MASDDCGMNELRRSPRLLPGDPDKDWPTRELPEMPPFDRDKYAILTEL